MICLGEVGELEVDRKRFRHLVCFSNVKTTDDLFSTLNLTVLTLQIMIGV